MVYDLCEILKQRIDNESLGYIETLAGLVQTEHVDKQASKTDVIEKSYPIYCPLNQQCNTKQLEPLVPDRKRKSLLYFEDLKGIVVNSTDRGYVNYTAYPRLVCWINPKLLGSENCSISGAVMSELISILVSNSMNALDFVKIRARVLNIPPRDPNLFSKYKYSRKFVQLLDYPYDYFAIDLAVDFSIHRNCITKYITQDPIEC